MTEAPAELVAPAKLTVTLRVTGVRDDGFHLVESEMVTLDLADTLEILPAPVSRLEVVDGWHGGASGVPGWRHLDVGAVEDNLVTRALEAVGRTAAVRLVKWIPPGAGLGGGSADAAAVLRWAGCTDPTVAARLGADVPFCLRGGRAVVSGIGERVAALPAQDRAYVLVLPPFGIDTAAVYRAYDRLAAAGTGGDRNDSSNDLEAAAVDVEPRLLGWKQALEDLTGRTAHLAGSGSTWFVEGPSTGVEVDGGTGLWLDGTYAPVVATRTTPGGG